MLYSYSLLEKFPLLKGFNHIELDNIYDNIKMKTLVYECDKDFDFKAYASDNGFTLRRLWDKSEYDFDNDIYDFRKKDGRFSIHLIVTVEDSGINFHFTQYYNHR